MKTLFTLIFLFNSSIFQYGECSHIPVQAVCEITKTDGTIVTGFIKTGISKCNEMQMNGFLSYQHKNLTDKDTNFYLKSINFKANFKSMKLEKDLIITTYKTSENKNYFNFSPRQSKLKYVIWKSKPSISKITKTDLGQECNQIHGEDYELSDSLVVYHELDNNLNILFCSENKAIIAINDISMVKLLEMNDTSNIVEIIRKGVIKNEKTSGTVSSNDFGQPIWYHDYVHTKEIKSKKEE